MTRTEIKLSVDNIRSRAKLIAVVEVGFPTPPALTAHSAPLTTMTPFDIRQRDRASSLFTQGHGRHSIRWFDDREQSFLGQSLVDWLIDDANVPGVHDAVLEAQSLLDGGWVTMVQAPPRSDRPAVNTVNTATPTPTFQLQAVYRLMEMRWVEVGRTEPQRGPTCAFTTTTSLMFALPESPVGGGCDGIVLNVTVFAVEEDGGSSGSSLPPPTSPTAAASSSTTSSTTSPHHVVATGTVALVDLLQQVGGWLVGPRQFNYPINVVAQTPSQYGLRAPPPTQRSSLQTYAMATTNIVNAHGERALVHVTETMVEIQGVARVAPKLLALYRERIAHIVRSFDTGGGGGMGVHRQKELGTNYQGWIQDHNQRHNQRQHNEGSRFKASRLVKDVSQQFDATNAHVHVCHVEDDKGYVQDLVHRVVGVSNSGCVCSLASFLVLCLCLFRCLVSLCPLSFSLSPPSLPPARRNPTPS